MTTLLRFTPSLALAASLAASLAVLAAAPRVEVPRAPFGLEAGAGREQIEAVLGAVQIVRPSVFMTSSVPAELPGLETLTLVATPNQGLCRVQATTGLITADPDGAAVRQRFAELRAKLEERFGEHRLVDADVADAGAEGDAGSERLFISRLHSRERVLMAVWSAGAGSSLAFNLESVTLNARALEDGRAFLVVDYVYTIWDYCQPSLEAAEETP